MSQRNRLFGVAIMTLVVTAGPCAWGQEPALRITTETNSVWVRAGEAPVLQYRYGDVPFKPYIKELFAPAGVNVLLDAPPDHLHHHALMFACAVNNVDFWGEAVGPVDGHFERLPGKQVHKDLTVTKRFSGVASEVPSRPPFGEVLQWSRQGEKEPLLTEHRSIMVRRSGKPEATLVTWESRLMVPDGKESATLGGSHYHGLGMRFIRSMDNDGEFRNPDNDPGVIFRGEERLLRSRWCAYTAKADGKPVTVAMFDHPGNPRHPATWFTMAKPFAYLSATMRLHEEPLKVLAGKPLMLRYGVALWDGRVETSQIDELYKQWVAMSRNNVSAQ